VKVGITLPTFEATASAALATAREAEQAGIDGVFTFDHLWPMGQPSRPALTAYPVLGAVAAVTQQIRVGPLVARVGLLADRLVADSLVSLQELAGGRLIAALGIGDSKSVGENEAYGIAWPPLESRRQSLADILGELAGRGIECWVGATAPATLDIARGLGVTVNLWDVDLARLEEEAERGPVTWGGPLPADAGAAADRLVALRDAGAAWAVWGWPRRIELVTEALELAGIRSRGE
jgi:hypothetical protein